MMEPPPREYYIELRSYAGLGATIHTLAKRAIKLEEWDQISSFLNQS